MSTSRQHDAFGRTRLSLRTLALVLATMSGSACGKDAASPPPASFFRFSVDGQPYTMESIPGGVVADQSLDGKTVEVVGLNWPGFSIGTQVSVRIKDFHGFGSYTLDDASAGGNFAYVVLSKDAGSTLLAEYITKAPGSGTLIISSYDADKRRISGAFSFTAVLDDGAGNPIVRVSEATFSGNVNVQ